MHTFLYISLPLLLHNYNVELSSYTFYRGNVAFSHKKILLVVLVGFLFHCRSFSPYWPLTFLIFSPPLEFSCCVSNEVRLLCFLSLFILFYELRLLVNNETNKCLIGRGATTAVNQLQWSQSSERYVRNGKTNMRKLKTTTETDRHVTWNVAWRTDCFPGSFVLWVVVTL